jgi:hypothetical protein
MSFWKRRRKKQATDVPTKGSDHKSDCKRECDLSLRGKKCFYPSPSPRRTSEISKETASNDLKSVFDLGKTIVLKYGVRVADL